MFRNRRVFFNFSTWAAISCGYMFNDIEYFVNNFEAFTSSFFVVFLSIPSPVLHLLTVFFYSYSFRFTYQFTKFLAPSTIEMDRLV
jgi:hypothetical protein